MVFHSAKRSARPDPTTRSRPSLSSSSRSSFSKIPSSTKMDTLVTLRASQPRGSEQVSMSQAGQRFIPAVFKLVPIKRQNSASTSNQSPDFHQAGGHDGSFSMKGSTLLKTADDREASFYEAAENGEWPSFLLPKYYGRANDDAIQIENLTYGFQKPCIMDLKMGVQTVEADERNLLKRLKMTALDRLTHSKSSGCRLEGLSMHRTLEDRRINGTKAQSHSISALVNISLKDVLTFFLTDESGVRTDIALRFQHHIENILAQFEKNDKYLFIGSSILLIYDNDNCAPNMRWVRALRRLHVIRPNLHLSEDQISGLTRRTRVDVRMIDFAHTGPLPKGATRDEGYITGLHTILDALKAIRAYRAKPIFSLASAVVDVMEEHRAKARSSASVNDDASLDKFTFGSLLAELTPLTATTSSPELENAAETTESTVE